MNAKQTAEYLGLEVQTIYNLRSLGRLPFHRINGRGRPIFIKEELDEAMGLENRAEAILNCNELSRRCR